MKRLVLIGPGNIAKYHIEAMMHFNFELVGCISREGSNASVNFMNDMGKASSEYFNEIDFMLKNKDSWDAVLICCPSKNQLEYIDLLASYEKPILVEKPVSFSPNNLNRYKHNNKIMVSFNRRYYESINKLKSFISKNKEFFVSINIPESSKSINVSSPSKFLPISIYENSIHIFDLINYLFGDVKWLNAISSSENKLEFMSVHGRSSLNIPISLNLMLDSPENFSISINETNKKIQLKPIEVFKKYQGFEVHEPSIETPIRRYEPKLIEEVYSEPIKNCKPGFYKQAKVFSELCDDKKNHSFPNINDAINAINSIQSISKLIEEN